jgi:DNA integrity scanning protein DisA with diadenylate cyclase activity
MSILNYQLMTTGMTDSPTGMIFLTTDENQAAVSQPGYLNKNFSEEQISGISKYMSALVYTEDFGTAWYRITVDNVTGIITLADF